MQAHRFRIATLAAALTGVAVRIFYVLTAVRDRIELGGDARTYHLLGKALADGRGYIRATEFFADGNVVPTAEFPPAYPALLAVLDVVGLDGPLDQRLAGALLGGVTVVVIGLLGEAVAGRTVGVVAAWIAALYPQLVVFDGSLLSEGPYALLIATALLAVLQARRADDPQRWRWWALASLAIGIAVMTRSEAFLLLPLLVIPASRVRDDPRAWARTAVVAATGTLVLVGAWTIRNAVTLGHFLPLTNNSGTLIAGANCDRVYDGVQIGGWRLDCVTSVLPAGLDETEAAAELRSIGLDYAFDHAGQVPEVMAVRVARTFGLWDIRSNLFFEGLEGRDYDWLWAAWYAWLAIAAFAIGGIVARRRAGCEVWPLLVPVAIAAVTSVFSYGNQRFRMIAEPGLVVLAAIGVVAVAGWVAARRAPVDQTQAPAGSS
ncbi:MAG: hypothetical protein HKN44_11295 [Ilumatobacter sp.]|nr:hypothetical protein [Ilumatobacter sp.]